MPRLKVYRTTIGFHDAYVAAPSQKAALEAWGTDKNLFARGAAEVVNDLALMEAPLARPGEVIKVSRGDLRAQLAALGPTPKTKAGKVEKSSKAKPDKAPPPPPPKKKPKPRPSRTAVDAAAAALEEARKRHDREMQEFREREAQLAREKAALQKRQDKEVDRLEAALARKRGAYAAALRKWQE